MHRSTDLSGTQFSTLKSAGFDQEKYNNTEVNYEAAIYGCNTALGTC
jgi:hypothetical protein